MLLISNAIPLDMLQKAVEQPSHKHSSQPPYENPVQTTVLRTKDGELIPTSISKNFKM